MAGALLLIGGLLGLRLWPGPILLGMGLLLLASPGQHRGLGVIVLIFTLATWVLLGSFLEDIEGVLAIRWRPPGKIVAVSNQNLGQV